MATPLNAAIMTVASAPGTGTITLGSALSGYQSFGAAGAVNGGSYSYRIDDGGAFELSVGTYTASGTTLTRLPVPVYSSTGSLLNASSAAIVTCVALAADISPVLATLALSGVASADVTIPAGYSKLLALITGIGPSASGAYLGLRFGDGGGVKAGASDYLTTFIQGASNSVGNPQDSLSYGSIARNLESGGTLKAISTVLIFPGASGQYPNAVATTFHRDSSPTRVMEVLGIDYAGTTTGAMGRATLLRFLASTGNVSANITVLGYT